MTSRQITELRFIRQAIARLTTAILIVLGASQLSQAGLIVSPNSIVANTLGQKAGNPAVNLINLSGLTGPNSFTSGVTDFDTYIAGNPTHDPDSSNVWISNNIKVGDLDFDLGSSLTIDKFAFWNRGFSSDSQLNGFTVFTSTVSNFSTSTNVGSFNATMQGSTTAVPVEVFDLTDSIGQYVRIHITSNHGSVSKPAVVAGEMAFGTSAASAAVPEPSSLALIICVAALGLTGYRLRCKKRDLPGGHGLTSGARI